MLLLLLLLPSLLCGCSRIDYDEFCRMMLTDEHEHRPSQQQERNGR